MENKELKENKIENKYGIEYTKNVYEWNFE